ncbi:MAG: tRNA guanosine(34) transglycosylase Tgt [Halobacteriovoraceae bacterium]|nr:tRNA guanosine(34) transglycosylase Tgt [Halobacteriovoraceae bacterium]MCB9095160.1 tRNA guanosine(34) transglycosylase Tgt [Halobacteriovoraceae bacterium]
MSLFKLETQDSKARAGTLTTTHSTIPTPVFMPVGTRAAVKSMTSEDLESLGAQIILGNTYHLYLRPGAELIEKLGGLHQFMAWKKSILTDSGGFQVYSLSDLNKVTDDGVWFQSHIDGSKHFIGPRESMEIQRALGSDIVMCFDECPALPATTEILKKSLEKTHRWAKTCREFELKNHQHLFGIVQGGLDLKLRMESLQALEELNFPGLAIGGLSVGEKNEEMKELLQAFVSHMPTEKPRYLMGVGKPLDILEAVKAGVDMFDCVLPTRNARNGQMLTSRGPLNIKNERFKDDQNPPDPDCHCRVCQRYTRAYIRHLITVGEYTAGQLTTYHNLHFYLRMMEDIRKSILEKRFDEFYRNFYNKFTSNNF